MDSKLKRKKDSLREITLNEISSDSCSVVFSFLTIAIKLKMKLVCSFFQKTFYHPSAHEYVELKTRSVYQGGGIFKFGFRLMKHSNFRIMKIGGSAIRILAMKQIPKKLKVFLSSLDINFRVREIRLYGSSGLIQRNMPNYDRDQVRKFYNEIYIQEVEELGNFVQLCPVLEKIRGKLHFEYISKPLIDFRGYWTNVTINTRSSYIYIEELNTQEERLDYEKIEKEKRDFAKSFTQSTVSELVFPHLKRFKLIFDEISIVDSKKSIVWQFLDRFRGTNLDTLILYISEFDLKGHGREILELDEKLVIMKTNLEGLCKRSHLFEKITELKISTNRDKRRVTMFDEDNESRFSGRFSRREEEIFKLVGKIVDLSIQCRSIDIDEIHVLKYLNSSLVCENLTIRGYRVIGESWMYISHILSWNPKLRTLDIGVHLRDSSKLQEFTNLVTLELNCMWTNFIELLNTKFCCLEALTLKMRRDIRNVEFPVENISISQFFTSLKFLKIEGLRHDLIQNSFSVLHSKLEVLEITGLDQRMIIGVVRNQTIIVCSNLRFLSLKKFFDKTEEESSTSSIDINCVNLESLDLEDVHVNEISIKAPKLKSLEILSCSSNLRISSNRLIHLRVLECEEVCSVLIDFEGSPVLRWIIVQIKRNPAFGNEKETKKFQIKMAPNLTKLFGPINIEFLELFVKWNQTLLNQIEYIELKECCYHEENTKFLCQNFPNLKKVNSYVLEDGKFVLESSLNE